MKKRIPIVLKENGDRAYAEALAVHLKTALLHTTPDAPVWLSVDADGLSLTDGDQAMCGDFTKLQKRLQYHNLTHELLVKATKVKGRENLRVIDATAGMGEDSLLLAAAGCEVTLYEQDPVIAFNPTRGLDVGAIEFVHKYLVAQRNKGRAILLVSFELDEIMNLSDRIDVIFDGQIDGEMMGAEADEYKLGLMMAGGKAE